MSRTAVVVDAVGDAPNQSLRVLDIERRFVMVDAGCGGGVAVEPGGGGAPKRAVLLSAC